MDDPPKFETWSEADMVGKLFAWYYLLRQQNDQIQQLQCSLKDAMKANRELLLKLKGQDDDWK